MSVVLRPTPKGGCVNRPIARETCSGESPTGAMAQGIRAKEQGTLSGVVMSSICMVEESLWLFELCSRTESSGEALAWWKLWVAVNSLGT